MLLKNGQCLLEIGVLPYHNYLYFLKGGLISIWRCRIRGCNAQKVLQSYRHGILNGLTNY